MKKGPFKLKGFSGFGEGTSPVKNVATSRNKSITPDAVLLEAAGQMKRGIDEGIAGSKGKARGYYAGMGALGFLDGLSKIKPRTQSDEDKKRQEEEKKRKKREKAWDKDDKRRKKKKKKEKKPVITVEPPTVESIDGKKTKGKTIIQRIFKRKKKK
tara:strand:+ start:118 stop:585 length:468 start_codon:yes stop_codon:yes gene_type:complete